MFRSGQIEAASGKPLIDLMREKVGSWGLLDPPPALTAASQPASQQATPGTTNPPSGIEDYTTKISNETEFQMRLGIFHNQVWVGYFTDRLSKN